MNELDDLLDELSGKVYVIVAFTDNTKTKIASVSERMEFDKAFFQWVNTFGQFDHVAHYTELMTEAEYDHTVG